MVFKLQKTSQRRSEPQTESPTVRNAESYATLTSYAQPSASPRLCV